MAVEELETDEDIPDPSRPSLVGLASAGHPFSIPWRREARPLLSSFDSRRAGDASGPWLLETPFDGQAMKMHVVLTDANSNRTSYREGLSSRSTSSTEHLSVALGITIGYPFLNANVTAEYDKTVITNENVSFGAQIVSGRHCMPQLLLTDGVAICRVRKPLATAHAG